MNNRERIRERYLRYPITAQAGWAGSRSEPCGIVCTASDGWRSYCGDAGRKPISDRMDGGRSAYRDSGRACQPASAVGPLASCLARGVTKITPTLLAGWARAAMGKPGAAYVPVRRVSQCWASKPGPAHDRGQTAQIRQRACPACEPYGHQPCINSLLLCAPARLKLCLAAPDRMRAHTNHNSIAVFRRFWLACHHRDLAFLQPARRVVAPAQPFL